MKKLLLATTALVAFAAVGSAGAADLPVKAAPMAPAYAPAMSWTGCYVSGGVGYGMWNQDVTSVTSPGGLPITAIPVTNGGRGWLGRVGVGCDYQVAPSFVIGAFGDFDFENIHGTFQDPLFGLAGVGDEKLSRSWAAGGRIGYLPYPNLMTYVSGGFTQARYDGVTLSTNIAGFANVPLFAFNSHNYNGWFIGGGTEYAVPWTAFHGLFWRTEYRYSQFKADVLPLFFAGTAIPVGVADRSEKFVQTVTTSLVWKFNWGGPVVARY